MSMDRKNLIAQWAFNTSPILGRFHLWLEDVEERRLGGGSDEEFSFVGPALEDAFIMTAAVTALGTRLFGRYGEGKGLDKAGINQVKKDADAVSAYAMSEALWYLTRRLPENHAVMVSLGEGLMPKAGETPEMGSNPLLGFGRVYARPGVAKFLDRRVHRMINDPDYHWDDFWREIQVAGLTVWGAAIDTLENTSRFAKGSPTGPLAVLHVFDQPLQVALPYEGYMGCLALPNRVVEAAEKRSTLLTYLTPRAMVMQAIQDAYPGIQPAHVHVWTLGGKARETRLASLWEEWRNVGAHVVEDGWLLPNGMASFNESGTYAPMRCIGAYSDQDRAQHVFILDGYAASAEAIQAASLDPMLGVTTSMTLFSSKFDVSWAREANILHLDPGSEDFGHQLGKVLGREAPPEEVKEYRDIILHARRAGMPCHARSVRVDDFFPNKKWRGLALGGFMLPDPYTGTPGVEQLRHGVYRVTAHATSEHGTREVAFTLRLMESFEESRQVFSPLLDRFWRGQDYRTRPVKISDSGRIRNELQTWCSEALEFFDDDGIRLRLDQVDDAVMSPEKRTFIHQVLTWYKQNHPTWFKWLEIC
ncbi:MAG: hypothetical protein KA072_14555 [Thermoanaerobaculaceae bacterium]|nr:hypothetical protein [Thermoanaerobaculaceae bacterium]MDI9620734.1 hypothetical protein [Acidobacteriota bacterium]HPW56807.1 hypothetical protein [Thermoanaerobaculaceae bacterium]